MRCLYLFLRTRGKRIEVKKTRFVTYSREFKNYDATVAKTWLKIASSGLSIFFVIISVCVTFESWHNYSGTEFRGAVSRLRKKIQICVCVFTFSLKLEK